jgi:hypothetical protein
MTKHYNYLHVWYDTLSGNCRCTTHNTARMSCRMRSKKRFHVPPWMWVNILSWSNIMDVFLEHFMINTWAHLHEMVTVQRLGGRLQGAALKRNQTAKCGRLVGWWTMTQIIIWWRKFAIKRKTRLYTFARWTKSWFHSKSTRWPWCQVGYMKSFGVLHSYVDYFRFVKILCT